ncbi:MAG: hypothetical protein WBW76_16115, partial [Candidatus Cybelea sp.]
VNGRPLTAARLSPMPRYATMVPEHHGGKKFEYVFNQYETYASIFEYPKSVKEIGQISGDGGQGCTNVLYGYGKKIFWNIGGNTQITEYKVPHTPIKTLSVTYSFPSSCAMDAGGDLAVGILYGGNNGGGGDVVIFKNGSGSGTAYTTALDEEFFDGYDNQGNLFADGFTGDRSGFALVELPKGSSKAETIQTSNSVQFPGSVQWDGTYLTVFDQDTEKVYQYTVSGTKATLKNTITLSGSSDCAQTWIVKGLIYCGDAGNDGGEVFNYPAGGSPIAVFTGSFDFPLGVVAVQK